MTSKLDEHTLTVLNSVQADIHETAIEHGFWDNFLGLLKTVEPKFVGHVHNQEQIVKLMFVVTELSEGVEALRHNDKSDSMLPEFSGLTVELADAMIRIIDLAAMFELPIFDAMLAKMKYNKDRERLHGKSL